MITFLKDLFLSYRLKKYSCKYAYGLKGLAKKTILVLEPHVKIGMVNIHGDAVKIGAHSYIRSGSTLHGHCSIGRFCSIGKNVTIGLEKNKHPVDWLSTSLFTKNIGDRYSVERKKTVISHDCWIGQNAIIMDGVFVGCGAIIGAGAIVTKDVPPYAVVVGAPARVIKFRFDVDLIDQLEKTYWWNYQVDFLEKLALDHPKDAVSKLDRLSYANYIQIEISRKNIIRSLL